MVSARAGGRSTKNPGPATGGATAHVFLVITDVAFFPPAACHPANAIGLKVFPPNTRTATVVSFSFRACARRGPVFLRVRTIVAGTGIPGFST